MTRLQPNDPDRLDDNTSRIIALEGGQNFRDIGGYATPSAGRVRRGLVFRSGTLANLTVADQDRIGRLGIKVVCDFRANRERTDRPSRWPESAAIDLWTRDHESSVGDLLDAMNEPGATAATVRAQMIATYRQLPYEQADSYRELFRRIAAGALPLVFHCSAGKDRTGVAAAVLLTILGVEREQVIEDFVLTERFFEALCRLVLTDPTAHRFNTVDRTIWDPMLRADRAYLEAMFETLDRRHGSTEGYLRDVLGIDDAAQAAIRDRLIDR